MYVRRGLESRRALALIDGEMEDALCTRFRESAFGDHDDASQNTSEWSPTRDHSNPHLFDNNITLYSVREPSSRLNHVEQANRAQPFPRRLVVHILQITAQLTARWLARRREDASDMYRTSNGRSGSEIPACAWSENYHRTVGLNACSSCCDCTDNTGQACWLLVFGSTSGVCVQGVGCEQCVSEPSSDLLQLLLLHYQLCLFRSSRRLLYFPDNSIHALELTTRLVNESSSWDHHTTCTSRKPH